MLYDKDFAQLLSILRGKKHRISVIKEFKMIKEFSVEGPWIQKVPADLPELLAELTAKQLKSVAETWTEAIDSLPTDESYSTFLDYLKLLQKLCKKSVKTEQSMYLWTCL